MVEEHKNNVTDIKLLSIVGHGKDVYPKIRMKHIVSFFLKAIVFTFLINWFSSYWTDAIYYNDIQIWCP